MSEWISRQAALDDAHRQIWYRMNQQGMKDRIDEWLKNLPSAGPERKTGKWINHRNDDGHNIADCDQCGNALQWFDGDIKPKYCPICGAKMEDE